MQPVSEMEANPQPSFPWSDRTLDSRPSYRPLHRASSIKSEEACAPVTTAHAPRGRTSDGFAGSSCSMASAIPNPWPRPRLVPTCPVWPAKQRSALRRRTRHWPRCCSCISRCLGASYSGWQPGARQAAEAGTRSAGARRSAQPVGPPRRSRLAGLCGPVWRGPAPARGAPLASERH